MPSTDVHAPGATHRTRPTVSWTTEPGQWRSTTATIAAVVAGATLLFWMVMCAAESLVTAHALRVSTHRYGLHFDIPLWAALVAALIAADYVPSAKILVHEGAHAAAGLCARADEVHINKPWLDGFLDDRASSRFWSQPAVKWFVLHLPDLIVLGLLIIFFNSLIQLISSIGAWLSNPFG